jgi:putative membrane protein
MLNLLIYWLVLSVSIWITAAVLPGVRLRSFGSAFGVAAIFGVLNALLGWALWSFFTIATLGLGLLLAFVTRWIINAILLTITDKISDALEIESFGWAVGAAMLMSLLGSVAEPLLR